MKKVLFLFLASCILASCGAPKPSAQALSIPDYLLIENGSIIWQKVYEGRMDQTELFRNLSGSGHFRDIQETEDYVTCYLRPVKMEFEPLGYRGGWLPIYLVNGRMTAFVTVQIKEDRYRVTVERMVFHLDRLGDTQLEPMALRENDPGQFKDSFRDNGPKNIINYNLGRIFDSLKQPRLSDEF